MSASSHRSHAAPRARLRLTVARLSLAACLTLLGAPVHAGISADDDQGETIPAPVDASAAGSGDADAGTLVSTAQSAMAPDTGHPSDPDSQSALLQYPHPHRS